MNPGLLAQSQALYWLSHQCFLKYTVKFTQLELLLFWVRKFLLFRTKNSCITQDIIYVSHWTKNLSLTRVWDDTRRKRDMILQVFVFVFYIKKLIRHGHNKTLHKYLYPYNAKYLTIQNLTFINQYWCRILIFIMLISVLEYYLSCPFLVPWWGTIY